MDRGHANLLGDLVSIATMAEQYKFHDFKASAATPKIALMMMLQNMMDGVKRGRYDNTADDIDEKLLRETLIADGASEAFLAVVFGEAN